jgi:hypothetical protein
MILDTYICNHFVNIFQIPILESKYVLSRKVDFLSQVNKNSFEKGLIFPTTG